MHLFGEPSVRTFQRRYVVLNARTGRPSRELPSRMAAVLAWRMPAHWQETALFSPTARQAVRARW